MHGLFAVGCKPHCLRREAILRYQCIGERFSPYNVRLRSQYALLGVLGHPVGGRRTYSSSAGRAAW